MRRSVLPPLLGSTAALMALPNRLGMSGLSPTICQGDEEPVTVTLASTEKYQPGEAPPTPKSVVVIGRHPKEVTSLMENISIPYDFDYDYSQPVEGPDFHVGHRNRHGRVDPREAASRGRQTRSRKLALLAARQSPPSPR